MLYSKQLLVVYQHIVRVTFTGSFQYNIHRLCNNRYISTTTLKFNNTERQQQHIWLCRNIDDQQYLLNELKYFIPQLQHNLYTNNGIKSIGNLPTTIKSQPIQIVFAQQLIPFIDIIHNNNNNKHKQQQRISYSYIAIQIVDKLYKALANENIHYNKDFKLVFNYISLAKSSAKLTVHKSQLDNNRIIDIVINQLKLHNNTRHLTQYIYNDYYSTNIQHLFNDSNTTTSNKQINNNIKHRLKTEKHQQKLQASYDILLSKNDYSITLSNKSNICIVTIITMLNGDIGLSIGTPPIYNKLYKCISYIDNGMMYLPSNPDLYVESNASKFSPPSSAYNKILEAELRGGYYLQCNQHNTINNTISSYNVLDFASSPGSFSYVYLHRNLRVHAIDPAPLTDQLMNMNNLYYEKGDAFTFDVNVNNDNIHSSSSQQYNSNSNNTITTQQPYYDLWCSDILCSPSQVLELIEKWLVIRPLQYKQYICRRYIIVIKFLGNEQYITTIQQLYHILLQNNKQLVYNIKRLNYNKNEITLYGYFNIFY